MLSIGKIALGQHRYYEQQVAQRRAMTTTRGRGEAPGEWVGAGARRSASSGRVSAGQFNALIAGMDPRDADARVCASIGRDPKVAAFDLTFSRAEVRERAVRRRPGGRVAACWWAATKRRCARRSSICRTRR